MPINHWIHETDKAKARVIMEAAGGVNLQPFTHGSAAFNPDTQKYDLRVTSTTFFYQTHVGLCLHESERNGRDDSDFFMTVWNPDTGKPSTIEFGSTRGYCGPTMGSSVDATPEVLAAYTEYQRKQAEEARRVHQERMTAMPAKGKMLKVVKGRKVPVGTEGRCFWSSTQFKMDHVLGILFMGYQGRVGIETADGQRYFTNAGNVEVVAA